ncbi:BREX-2 system phosphatase PglZ [Actinorhabdospora filicis]|nr:BREX-2 system phosphatase PglZ [Actinorhabdospora filicis]
MTVTADVPVVQPHLILGEARGLVRKRTGSHNVPPVMLLRASADWTGDELLKIDGEDGTAHTVRVRPARSVLAVLDAIDSRSEHELLIVLSPFREEELGPNVLARVVEQRVFSLGLWDVLLGETGADRLDPVLQTSRYRWLVEAVLGDGDLLRRVARARTPVLRARDLLQRLAALRLGFPPGESIDPATLLTWSRRPGAFASFGDLPKEEREGITSHLGETIGPVAEIVLSLADPRKTHAGKLADAIPLGLVVDELYTDRHPAPEQVRDARIRLERHLPEPPPSEASLRTFGRTCAALVERWTEGAHAQDAEDMYARAGALLGELRVGDLAEHSRVLPEGFRRRLDDLAKAIGAARSKPDRRRLEAAEAAYVLLVEHRLAKRSEPVHRRPMAAASNAIRLLRWLSIETPVFASLEEGLTWQIRVGGWVDRALRVLAWADTTDSPTAARVYRALFTAVRERRTTLDRAFALKLAAWKGRETEHMLLAENLMRRVARPLVTRGTPLLIVIDGMSAADATAIGEDLARVGDWIEAGRNAAGREGALAVIPSMTTYSRTSLLTGSLTAGGQKAEDTGFTAFWKGRPARLFHKDDLRGTPGSTIPDELRDALMDPKAVVGVVLNSIDDALQADERISAPLWTLDTVDYLAPLMREAANAGRPVIITSDHGHIRDYGGRAGTSGESARFRAPTDAVDDGEVLLDGDRVVHGNGRIVAAYDESLRYRMRKAGYHGGASLAEMAIPVLVYLPVGMSVPADWDTLTPSSNHEPQWWGRLPAAMAEQAPAGRRPVQDETLFGPETLPAAADGLGARVVGTAQFTTMLKFGRTKLDGDKVAALIDGLDEAGGRLPIARAAEITGLPLFRIDGYISQLSRILNLDGYQVLTRIDGGRTLELDRDLLAEQFLGGTR